MQRGRALSQMAEEALALWHPGRAEGMTPHGIQSPWKIRATISESQQWSETVLFWE